MYDFQALLHIDLIDLTEDMCSSQPQKSPRYCLAMINGLPDNGAFAASLSGGREYRGWGVSRHMIADLWDMKMAELSNPKKGKAPRYPRPGGQRSEGRSLVSMSPLSGKRKRKGVK